MHNFLLSHCAAMPCGRATAAWVDREPGCGKGFAPHQVFGIDAAAMFTTQSAPDMTTSAVTRRLDLQPPHRLDFYPCANRDLSFFALPCVQALNRPPFGIGSRQHQLPMLRAAADVHANR